METGKIQSKFEPLATFMTQNAVEVKVLSYGITSVGLLIALHRVKPFARFKHPHEVPNHFLSRKVPLQGVIKHIEPSNGTVLMVEHKPLIPLPYLGKRKYLPVKIAGINVTHNGISWLQSVVGGSKITFIPVSKEQEYLNCLVILPKLNKESLDIGKELVKLGFATTHELQPPLLKDKTLLNYCKSLLRAEEFAKRKRNGHWHFVIYPSLFWKTQNLIFHKMKLILPQFITKQLNV